MHSLVRPTVERGMMSDEVESVPIIGRAISSATVLRRHPIRHAGSLAGIIDVDELAHQVEALN